MDLIILSLIITCIVFALIGVLAIVNEKFFQLGLLISLLFAVLELLIFLGVWGVVIQALTTGL